MSERDSSGRESVGRENLELARVLAGEGRMSDQDFLETMARSDRDIPPGEEEVCGMSCNIRLGAQVAREMLEAGEYEDVPHKWAVESRRRWEASKFVQLYQEARAAGRDPARAFEERGWGM